MPKKKVILSLLEGDPLMPRQVGGELAKAGLEVLTHEWIPDLKRHAWHEVAQVCGKADAWVIAGDISDSIDVRKSLAMAALELQSAKGYGFPIFLTGCDGTVSVSELPTPLQGIEIVRKGIGVKCAVQAQSTRRIDVDYRLRPNVLPGGLGLWFEIGPSKGSWKGTFFACGADGNEKAVPDVQGVGMKDSIPAECTLEYPLKQAKLTIAGISCEGWGAMNELDIGHSHYIRVGDVPDVMAFGPFPAEDDCELFTVRLR